MAKQIIHGEESRQAILRGVNLLADAVKVILRKSGIIPASTTGVESSRSGGRRLSAR